MIKNITKNKILTHNCNICRNFLTRGIGLMFKKKMTPTVLAFKKEHTAAIHTFFVKHYLDVLFLNGEWEIIDMVEGMQPGNLYTPKHKAMFILELPEGTIAKSRTALGDVINFK